MIFSAFSHTFIAVFGFLPPFPLRQRTPPPRFNRNDKRARINEQITAPEVLLVSEEGGAERLKIADALVKAKEAELDLIEVSPKAVPPVVKIDDFGHYLYQLQKKEKKQKSHGKQSEVKMLRFGFRTEKHDLDRIIDRAKEFLGEHHMVKLSVRLRGRELTNKDYAVQKMKGLIDSLKEEAEVEQPIKAQGTQFIAVLRPKR